MVSGQFIAGFVEERSRRNELEVRRQDLANRKRAVDISEEQQRQRAIQQAFDRFKEVATMHGKMTGEAIARSASRSPELDQFVQDRIEDLVKTAVLLEEQFGAGVGFSQFVEAIAAELQEFPTLDEAAAAQAQAAVAGQTAQRDALVTAGADPEFAGQEAGLVAEPDTDLGRLQQQLDRDIREGRSDRALQTLALIGNMTATEPPDSAIFEEDGSMKVNLQSELRRQTAQLFDTIDDQRTGAIVFKKAPDRRLATQINVIASTLLRNGSANNIARAVRMAAAGFGLDFPAPQFDVAERAKIIAEAVEAIAEGEPEAQVLEQLRVEFGISEKEFRSARN